MEYWSGIMNWGVKKGWVCETCGQYHGLEWGFVHGQCRCLNCHTQYTMIGDNGKVFTVPNCLLKDEFKQPIKLSWEKYQIPITEMTDEQILEFKEAE